MARAFDIVTFDCYGTLVDWEGGIFDAFREAAAAEGVELDRASVLRAHAEIEPRVQAGAFRSYREVLEETAVGVARRLGWKVHSGAFLPQSLASWEPFPDTGPALERLAAGGLRLGILSNVDDDLLAATLGAIGVEFELRVTAEQVGSYKPAHGHFVEARRRVGAARWLHAAQSWFHDLVPASELGIPAAWINRKRERAGRDAAPLRELSDLTALADWLVGA